MMHIDKETKVWVNTDAHYKGFSKLDTPEIRERAGLIEVPDPTPPADYSDETYYRHETPDRMPPYVTFERKSDEQLAQLAQTKANAAALAYLAETDWKMRRHDDELLAGKPPSLDAGALADLLKKRAEARATVVTQPNR